MSSITDFNLSGSVYELVNEIETVTNPDIVSAAQRVVEAAEEAQISEGPRSDDGEYYSTPREWIDSVPGTFDWIPERYERFYARNPWSASNMAERVGEAKVHLESGNMSDIHNVERIVTSKFAGDTQKAFVNNFLNPFGPAVGNQQAVFAELQAGLLAYEALLRQSRADAKKIAEKTVDALDGLGGGFLGTGSGSEVSVGLAVAGAVVGVVGAAATGGTSLAITFAIVGGGISVTSAALGAGDDGQLEETISGGSVQEVLEGMQSALNDLWDLMEKTEIAISAALRDSASELGTYLNSDSSETKRTILPHEVNSNASGDPEAPPLSGDDPVSLDPEDGEFYPNT